MSYLIGIDIGGTCTDCVVVDDQGAVTLAKAFSTPPNYSRGIFEALELAAAELTTTLPDLLGETQLFLHSTTVAENAVVDGTLAKAGLITTRGFEDTLFATRGGYGRWSGLTEDEKRNPIETDKLPPLVPSSLIEGIRERTDVRGEVLVQRDDTEIEAAVRRLLAQEVEALGVCLLWSLANPGAELAVAEVVRRIAPDVFLTLSHDTAPVVGEYERTSTVALNARLGPIAGRYLGSLSDELEKSGFSGALLIMQAHGGLLPLADAATRPVGMIESGPVSALVGSRELGQLIEVGDIIAADMGGTTFKVGVVRDGHIEYQRESMVLRHHYALPKLDVLSLGLAGGSIVSVDPRTGNPRIGPRSAGSYPGPVAYGHGGEEPTLTDVDAILGYLDPAFFLGGRGTLDIQRAQEVFTEKVAEPLGQPTLEAAAAMYRLANSLIHDLLHKATVQRGLDPRRFSLFSFGGTAGMHVAAYGAELGVEKIVIPHSASVHGAFGLVISDVAHVDQVTSPLRAPADAAEVEAIFAELRERMVARLEEDGFSRDQMDFELAIDMRYRRQVHIVSAPVQTDGPIHGDVLEQTIEHFERRYEERYGEESAYREAGIELVTFRLRGAGRVQRPAIGRATEAGSRDPSPALVRRTEAWVDEAGEVQEAPGYDFERLLPGNVVEGPAIIWTPITTLVVAPSQTAELDSYKNIIVSEAQRRCQIRQ